MRKIEEADRDEHAARISRAASRGDADEVSGMEKFFAQWSRTKAKSGASLSARFVATDFSPLLQRGPRGPTAATMPALHRGMMCVVFEPTSGPYRMSSIGF